MRKNKQSEKITEQSEGRFSLRKIFVISLLATSCLSSASWAQGADEAGWMTISQINALPYQASPSSSAAASAMPVAANSVDAAQFTSAVPATSGATVPAPSNAALLRDDDIYLDVTVNGEMRQDMYPFRQLPSGSLVVHADVLRSVGLLPVKSVTNAQGFVDLDRLPHVTYLIRDGNIVDFVTTDASALAPYTASLTGWGENSNQSYFDEEMRAQSDLIGVLNYSIYADTGGDDFGRLKHLNGISGIVEGRVSGKFGSVFSSQLWRYHPDLHPDKRIDKFDTIRLESYWSYSDEERMMSYQAGDVITRSLPWSRSTRLGGFQLRRNFSLREDLLTTPMPSITGSAALPSTVDVYINNAQIATRDVPAGPYTLTNMPVISGANNARIIVRDATGRETVTNMAFFGHSDLLGKGLADFSFEAGFPRRNFGSKSGDYSGDFMVSATGRYGVSDRVTLEGHAEAGKDFFNAGVGSTVSLADIGAISLAGSSSVYRSVTGQQLYASVQLHRWGFYFNARTQHSYGNYHDMASIVDAKARERDPGYWGGGGKFFYGHYRGHYASIRPPKSTTQLSLSTNLRFDPTTLSVAYTEARYWDREGSKILSLSASRNFAPRVQGYVNAYLDLKDSHGYGIFGGVSVNFDNQISASVNSTTNHNGTSVTTQVSRSMGNKVGDYGLTVRDTEGKQTRRGVEGRYRAKFATVAASVEQYRHDSWRATAQADGALVFAEGEIIPAQRLYNSFAVVNAGAPHVGVYANNSYHDKTWRNGRLVVPDLYSYRTSSIKLDVDSMPVDMLVESTEVKVKPAHNSGVIVNFGISGNSYAQVAIVDNKGNPIEAGSYAELVGSGAGFDIGYDGVGILPLEGVRLPATLQVHLPDNRSCQVKVPASLKKGVSAGTQSLSCR